MGIALTIGLNQKAFGIDSELHFNSQAAIFGQAVREMSRLLDIQGALTLDNQVIGFGDLYVTVYGGRTRLVGILLGRGLTITEAKEALQGVTLESLKENRNPARRYEIRILHTGLGRASMERVTESFASENFEQNELFRRILIDRKNLLNDR